MQLLAYSLVGGSLSGRWAPVGFPEQVYELPIYQQWYEAYHGDTVENDGTIPPGRNLGQAATACLVDAEPDPRRTYLSTAGRALG